MLQVSNGFMEQPPACPDAVVSLSVCLWQMQRTGCLGFTWSGEALHAPLAPLN
jgi:hypothetical protein